MPDSIRPRRSSGGKVQGHRITAEPMPAAESTCQIVWPRRRFTARGGRKTFFCSNRLREQSLEDAGLEPVEADDDDPADGGHASGLWLGDRAGAAPFSAG